MAHYEIKTCGVIREKSCYKIKDPDPNPYKIRPVTKSKGCFFLEASERRVLPIVGVCISSSHLHTISSSHLLIFTSSHLHIFSSSHLLIFTSSHLHIFSSSHLLIFTSSHLHIFSSSHLLILTSSHFTSSHLHIFTSSHPHIFTSSHLHLLLQLCGVGLCMSPGVQYHRVKE